MTQAMKTAVKLRAEGHTVVTLDVAGELDQHVDVTDAAALRPVAEDVGSARILINAAAIAPDAVADITSLILMKRIGRAARGRRAGVVARLRPHLVLHRRRVRHQRRPRHLEPALAIETHEEPDQ